MNRHFAQIRGRHASLGLTVFLITTLLITGCSGGGPSIDGDRPSPGGGPSGGGGGRSVPEMNFASFSPSGAPSFGGGREHTGGGLGGPGGAGASGPGFSGFDPASFGGGLGGERPGGGDRPGNGNRPGGDRPGGDRPGGDGPEQGSGPGEGFFSGAPRDLGGFGGFGIRVEESEGRGNRDDWSEFSEALPNGLADRGQEDWPELPAIYDQLQPAQDRQEEAQEAVEQAQEKAEEARSRAEEAAENASNQAEEARDQAVEAAEQANARSEDAVEQAQQAYDQVWDDYYEAVDYAAQTYYDAVTGVAGDRYATYEAAVSAAYDVADYVYETYEAYGAYCLSYPWDCYTYVYDAATGSYTPQETTTNTYYNVYVNTDGETSADATPAPPPEVSVTTEDLPEPSAEAYEALVIFANDQLGLTVDPVYAGEATEEILVLLANLPAELQQVVAALPDVAVENYWGLLTGGAAAVAVGDCTEDAPCTITGEIEVDLSSASLGAYALRVPEAMPADAEQALALIHLVYPKLEGIAFAPVEQENVAGHAFYAVTSGLGLDADGNPIAVSKVIYAGVTPDGEIPTVYAVVGVGSYSGSLGWAE